MAVNLLNHGRGEKTVDSIELFLSEKDDFIDFYNRTQDLGNYFCVRKWQGKAKQQTKVPQSWWLVPRAVCTVSFSWQQFHQHQARSICSKVPETHQTDSPSLALLGLLARGAGNQLADRLIKLYATVWTNIPKRLSARCGCWTSSPSPWGRRSCKGEVRDKRGQIWANCVRCCSIVQMDPLNPVYPIEEGFAARQLYAQPAARTHIPSAPHLHVFCKVLPILTFFKVLPWCEKPVWTWGREFSSWILSVKRL